MAHSLIDCRAKRAMEIDRLTYRQDGLPCRGQNFVGVTPHFTSQNGWWQKLYSCAGASLRKGSWQFILLYNKQNRGLLAGTIA